MNKAPKVALLSGLVFPGIGHLVLKQRARGWALIVTASIALTAIITVTVQRALVVANRIANGEIPMNVSAINEAVASASTSSNEPLMSIALILFGLCWIFGIVDSYRLGVAEEKSSN